METEKLTRMQSIGGVINQGKKLRKASDHTKRLLLYGLSALLYQALVIALVFLLTRAFAPSFHTIPALYPIFLVVFFLLGLIHAWLESHYLPQLSQGGIGGRLLYGLALVLVGILLLAAGTHYIAGPTRWPFVFAGTTSLFLVPLLWREAFRRWRAVPQPAFKPWWLPVNRPPLDIDMVDLSAVQVIRFEFRREPGDPVRADSRAKAPTHMTLGDLFHVFLTDYNERFQGSPIRLFDEQQQPFGWIFYVRPRRWWQTRRYLDPTFNFDQNRINDSDRVVAHRVDKEQPVSA